jgi:hypothetical protein
MKKGGPPIYRMVPRMCLIFFKRVPVFGGPQPVAVFEICVALTERIHHRKKLVLAIV